ncbi:IS1182 family transposase [Carboxylicivirga mesophila]|uniref:IS1182 family transposase n=1 Tax=Carboxylicivirga mesophila TaxID=1166478 RepID=A0ABS5KAJ1_9BACT|nr:IS1182 family transposase [Carboxylicivirga mesophila]MBS2211867.1 IS1182 family transposase [Carboxylicivirga mesophila]
MKYIQGQHRSQIQLFTLTLDDAIEADNEVRLIDAFVSHLKLDELGFDMQACENGRPCYHPGDLLRLFIYGYFNRIRSSRSLEKECKRNIELMWLLRQLKPDHNTIANFRRDNPKAIKRVFKETVRVAKYFNLIGGQLLAGDGTKLRAQNSKKNNFNQKKIDRHLQYIENKLDEYNQALAKEDGDSTRKKELQDEITKQEQRKEKYHKLEAELKETGAKQVSTSDPESRQMIIRNNITEVAYNVQTTVDARHNLPIDYQVTNQNDSKAMGNMLTRAVDMIGHNNFTALYDKGYHTGSEFAVAANLGVDVLVAIPATPKNSQAPDPAFNVEHFKYEPDLHTYTCPAGQILTTNGRWHKANRGGDFQLFRTPACKGCASRARCTSAKINGRIIRHTAENMYVVANKARVEANPKLYKRRQAIVEHPYGTIKRQWGFDHIITKQSLNRASANVGLMMTAYNLRRIINILGMDSLLSALMLFISFFKGKNVHRNIIDPLNLINDYLNGSLTDIFCSQKINLVLNINTVACKVFRQTAVGTH